MEHKEEYRYVGIPLYDFEWDEEATFLFTDNIKIARVYGWPYQDKFKDYLSKIERNELEGVSHWLQFAVPWNGSQSGEIATKFLLSLWLSLHSRTHAKYRFEIFDQGIFFVPLLDQFQWVEPYADDYIEARHLEEAAIYFEAINKLWGNRKRLWHSMVLTSAGCMAKRWQVAIMCFTAALEGILTYRKGNGITKRLSSSFACLTETEKKERDAAYKKFYEVYNVRSDIMHGRINDIDESKRLYMVNQASNLLRPLWRIVLSTEGVQTELERDDNGRELFFSGICKGYTTPKT